MEDQQSAAQGLASEETKKEFPLSQSLKLPINTASTICYGAGFLPFLGWISGLLILFLEKDNRVRFHAYQAVVLFGFSDVVRMVLGQTILLSRLGSLIYLLQFVLWLVLLYQTYEGKTWVLPIIGPWAKKQLSGTNS